VGAAALVASGVALGVRHALRRSLPRPGLVRIAGLDGEVEILRDRWGVPHIYARTEHDLFFANGVVHGEDRFWQMEVNRRAATGRLSELFGAVTFETDRFMRTVGLGRAARAEEQSLDPPTRAVLDAYIAGVNWAIEARPRPPELLLLRHDPEPWTIVDTLAWAKLMGWGISANWGTELVRAKLVARLGPQLMAELEPRYPNGGWLSAFGAELADATSRVHETYELLHELTGLPGMGGSNAWAVAPKRSASGRAMLASDLHLSPQTPSIWYEIGLDASDVDGEGIRVYGSGLAGIPGIVNGHNGHIAWGTPASLADVQDLFVERAHPEHPRRFARDDGWEDAVVVREEIRVRGRRGWHTEEVAVSSNGVVITSLLDGVGAPISLRTTAAEASHTIRAGIALMRARGWNDFRAALTDWGTPSLSFTYADGAGNIGHQMAGLTPRREKGNGLVPAPGWETAYAWKGFLKQDELPSSFNPPEGFIAVANNQLVGPEYPHAIGEDFADAYRVGRIVELLRARPTHDPASMVAIQLDVTSPAAREFVAKVRTILDGEEPLDPLEREALRELLAWDGELSVDSIAGSIYQWTRAKLKLFLYAPKLGDLLYTYLGVASHPLGGSTFLWRATSHLLRVLDDPEWPEKMGHRGLTWRDVLLIALGEGVSALRLKYGEDPTAWRWGRLHQLRLDHHLGRFKPLDRLLNLGPFPIGGDGDTPLQSGATPWALERVSVVPSTRQVIDFADLNGSTSIHPGGQSGHVGSPHYADQLELWRRGEAHPMLWDRAEVEAHLESETRLLPTDELWPRP
jgi:penicillin amidase